LKKYAGELSLDQKKFDECLDSGKYESEVQNDMSEGGSYGVSGTPSFFVNGQLLVGAQPYSEFKKIIDAELAK
jgi:protein-disulfide isomerase